MTVNFRRSMEREHAHERTVTNRPFDGAVLPDRHDGVRNIRACRGADRSGSSRSQVVAIREDAMKGLLSGLIVASSILAPLGGCAADAPALLLHRKSRDGSLVHRRSRGRASRGRAARCEILQPGCEGRCEPRHHRGRQCGRQRRGRHRDIVVPDQQIGPAILAKAKEAKIPVIAVDDSIKDADGKEAPFVGFSAIEGSASRSAMRLPTCMSRAVGEIKSSPTPNCFRWKSRASPYAWTARTTPSPF